MRKQWYRKIRLYLALGAMVCSLSGCGAKEQESVSLEKNDGKENRTEIAKESEENKVLEVIEELTKDVWVNTKITVYNSEDTSLSPRTMTEMTYDQEGRLLTKYVTDYELAQYPFVKETLEYEYDKDGNILKHLEINEMYGTKTFQTFRYDDNGNKIAEMKDDNSVTLYEYDENGRLMAERTHMADPAAMGDRAWAMDHPGEVRMEFLYTYNDAGQLVEKRQPNRSFEDSWNEYIYDDAGNLIEDHDFNFGQNSSLKKYTYDEKGNCLLEEDISLSGDSSYDISIECAYNDVNVCVSRKVSFGGNLSSETTYNDQGDILTFINYDDGEIANKLSYEYDEEGREIRLEYENFSEKGVSEYEYDKNGNRKCGRSYDSNGNLTRYSVYEYDKIK